MFLRCSAFLFFNFPRVLGRAGNLFVDMGLIPIVVAVVVPAVCRRRAYAGHLRPLRERGEVMIMATTRTLGCMRLRTMYRKGRQGRTAQEGSMP